MKFDIGSYHLNPARFQELMDEMYANNPSVTLSPEYGHYVQNDLLRLLIRLARYKFVARLLKKTDRVLEIGSGTGLGSIFMAQHCAHVVGLDVKSTEVEDAQRLNRRDNIVVHIIAIERRGRTIEQPIQVWLRGLRPRGNRHVTNRPIGPRDSVTLIFIKAV